MLCHLSTDLSRINIVGVEPFLAALKANIETPKYQRLCKAIIAHTKMDELISEPHSGVNAFLALPKHYQTQKTPPDISHLLTPNGAEFNLSMVEEWSLINSCSTLHNQLLSLAQTKPLELLNYIEQLPGTVTIQLPLVLELLNNQEIQDGILRSKDSNSSFTLPCQIVSAIHCNIADVAKFIKSEVTEKDLPLASNMLSVIKGNDESNELLIAVASEMIKDPCSPLTRIMWVLGTENIELWSAEHIDTFAPLMGERLTIVPNLATTLEACHFPESHELRFMIIPKMLPHLLTHEAESLVNVNSLMRMLSIAGSSHGQDVSAGAMQNMISMAIKNAPITALQFIQVNFNVPNYELERLYLAACKLDPMSTAELKGLVENSQLYLSPNIKDTDCNTGDHVYKIMMGDYQRGQEFFALLTAEEKSKVARTIMNNIWQSSPKSAQFFLNYKTIHHSLLIDFIAFLSHGDVQNFVSSAQVPECVMALCIAISGFNYETRSCIKVTCSEQQIRKAKQASVSEWQKNIASTAGWVAALSFYDIDDAVKVFGDLSDETALEVLKSPVWEQDLPYDHPNYPKSTRVTSGKQLRHVTFNALPLQKQLQIIHKLIAMKSAGSKDSLMDLAQGVLVGDAQGNLTLPKSASSTSSNLIKLLQPLPPEQQRQILTLDFCKLMVKLGPIDCGAILTRFAPHHLDSIILTAEPESLLKIALAKNCPAKISAHVSKNRVLSKQILPPHRMDSLRTNGDAIFVLFDKMPSHLISEVFQDFSDEQIAVVLLAPNCPQSIIGCIISNEKRITSVVAALIKPATNIHQKLEANQFQYSDERLRLVFQKRTS